MIKKLVNAFGSNYHPKQKIENHQKTRAVRINNLNSQPKRQHPKQMLFFRNHLNENHHQNYAPTPVYHQNQPQVGPQLNHVYNRPKILNPRFFQLPTQQGMG